MIGQLVFYGNSSKVYFLTETSLHQVDSSTKRQSYQWLSENLVSRNFIVYTCNTTLVISHIKRLPFSPLDIFQSLKGRSFISNTDSRPRQLQADLSKTLQFRGSHTHSLRTDAQHCETMYQKYFHAMIDIKIQHKPHMIHNPILGMHPYYTSNFAVSLLPPWASTSEQNLHCSPLFPYPAGHP